jgi:hypothetical protein
MTKIIKYLVDSLALDRSALIHNLTPLERDGFSPLLGRCQLHLILGYKTLEICYRKIELLRNARD